MQHGDFGRGDLSKGEEGEFSPPDLTALCTETILWGTDEISRHVDFFYGVLADDTCIDGADVGF